MGRKSMITPYKHCKKCGVLIVSGNLCEDCKPMTNGDRIRKMTDEELAEWLDKVTDCCSDRYMCEKCPIRTVQAGDTCSKHTIEKWLRKEADEDAGTETD